MAQLRELYQRLLEGRAGAEDHAAFLQLLMEPEREAEARELLLSIAQEEVLGTGDHTIPREQQEMLATSILTAAGRLNATPVRRLQSPAYRVFFSRKWRRVAALLVAALGLGVYFWLAGIKDRDQAPVAQKNEVIAPGGNKATLTLADGSRIILDSAANGTLASQGNASIIKLANGQIVYDLQGSLRGATIMNTMTTPRGGQYRLVLPDGTKVWLNAASSLTYPVSFTGPERRVSVTGEAYFEVAGNKAMPFMVNIGSGSSVEVLGTHFNINGYADEGTVRTTLLEGSIKVSCVSTGRPAEAVVIKPGQQVQMAINADAPDGERLQVVRKVDLEEVIAWKNGIFYFREAGLPQVMKQLERWYDINVQFTGKVPVLKINGKMDRGLTLQEVLEFLTKMEVHCHLEGRTIIVDGN